MDSADQISFFGQLLNPTDFKIIIGNFSFSVHKDLVTEKSGFFRTLCSGQFQESQTNEVTLHEEDITHVARMISWVYTGKYPYGRHERSHVNPVVTMDQMMRAALCEKDAQGIDDLLPMSYRNNGMVTVDLRLYVMADKYDCPDLCSHCAAHIFQLVDLCDDWSSLWMAVDFIKEELVDIGPLKDRLCKYLGPRLRNLHRATKIPEPDSRFAGCCPGNVQSADDDHPETERGDPSASSDGVATRTRALLSLALSAVTSLNGSFGRSRYLTRSNHPMIEIQGASNQCRPFGPNLQSDQWATKGMLSTVQWLQRLNGIRYELCGFQCAAVA